MLRPSRPMMRPFISSLGRLDHGDGALGDVVGGAALDRQGDDFARPALGLLLRLGLGLLDHHRHLVLHFAFDPAEQVFLGFVGSSYPRSAQVRLLLGDERSGVPSPFRAPPSLG